jgi:predicted anti-sigma-YlaC factor YlaD
MKDACSRYVEAISAQLDGEDLGMSAAELEDHLSRCAACRDFEAEAISVNRAVRIRQYKPVPDLALEIADTIQNARPRAKSRTRLRFRLLLGLTALAQLALTGPALFGGDPDIPPHAAHELGSFGVALGAGFLAVAWRPARAAGLAALTAVVAAGLLVTAAADVASGVTSAIHEMGHLPELIGFALVWILAAPEKPRPLEPGGEMMEAA